MTLCFVEIRCLHSSRAVSHQQIERCQLPGVPDYDPDTTFGSNEMVVAKSLLASGKAIKSTKCVRPTSQPKNRMM